jgi:hypothetical protein
VETDHPDYLSVIRQLPRPTLAQTERFARYVSGAHSWYKHLPVRPKVPFVFYLDPGAGMNRVHTRTREVALVEITDKSKRFHYTWQKTEDYRRRFGFWNYHAPYGMSFMFAGEGGVVSTAGAGLKVLTTEGDWVSVPPELIDKGTAQVNAMVHPMPNLLIWSYRPDRYGLSDVPAAEGTGFPDTANDILRRVWSVLQDCRSADPQSTEAISQETRDAVQRAQEKQEGRKRLWPYGRNWDWPTESWLEGLESSGIDATQISSAVKYVEVEDTRSAWTKAYGQREGTASFPGEAMAAVVGEIMVERGRQLAAMTHAMNRFSEAVFS